MRSARSGKIALGHLLGEHCLFGTSQWHPWTRQVSGHEFTRAVKIENILGFSPCKKDRLNFTVFRLRSPNHSALVRAFVSPWRVFSVHLFALASPSTWANTFSPDKNRAPEARNRLAHPEASNAKPEGWVRHTARSSPVGATQENAHPTATLFPSPKLRPATRQVSGHEFTRAVQPQNIPGFSPCHKKPQGLKADYWKPPMARLKSCPDTCLAARSRKVPAKDIHLSVFLRASASPRWVPFSRSPDHPITRFREGVLMIVMKLSRFAGVSEAGARRRNPERAQRVEGSRSRWRSDRIFMAQVLP